MNKKNQPKDSTKSVEELTEQTLRDGGLLVLFYFDMQGKTPESVQNLMVEFLATLANDPLAVYTYGEIEKSEQYDGETYSTYAEVKVLVRNLQDLVQLVLKYTPVAIDIIKPHEVKLSVGQLQSILMDLSAFSSNFTMMYMQKGLSEEKRKEYQEAMKRREELGRRLIEESRGKREVGS